MACQPFHESFCTFWNNPDKINAEPDVADSLSVHGSVRLDSKMVGTHVKK